MSSEVLAGEGSAATASGGRLELTARERRRIVLASGIGTALEFYDFGVYGYLAIIIAANFFSEQNPVTALLSTLATFAVAFLVRPIGGIIFGHIGDKISRKRALALSVLGMATATFLIGILPTYAVIGVFAPILLVTLRIVQGLSAGGEIGGAVSMISESVPNQTRGFWTSLAQSGSLVGLVLASATVGLCNMLLTAEQMSAWGWRLPFLMALPTGVVGIYVRSRLEESALFLQVKREGKVARIPILEVLRRSKGAVAKAFGIAAMDFAAYYVVFVYLSIYIVNHLDLSSTYAQWSTSATIMLALLTLPLFGWLSDRIGRRKVVAGSAVMLIVLPMPLFMLLNSGNLVIIVLAQMVLGLCVAAIMGVIWAALAELFGTGIRFSGMALGFNLGAALVGGLTPYISEWLLNATGSVYSPAWWLIGVSAVTLLTALTLRETARADLAVVGTDRKEEAYA